jgi:hypothetical protein
MHPLGGHDGDFSGDGIEVAATINQMKTVQSLAEVWDQEM